MQKSELPIKSEQLASLKAYADNQDVRKQAEVAGKKFS